MKKQNPNDKNKIIRNNKIKTQHRKKGWKTLKYEMEERDNSLPTNWFVALRTIVNLFSKSVLLSTLQNEKWENYFEHKELKDRKKKS